MGEPKTKRFIDYNAPESFQNEPYREPYREPNREPYRDPYNEPYREPYQEQFSEQYSEPYGDNYDLLKPFTNSDYTSFDEPSAPTSSPYLNHDVPKIQSRSTFAEERSEFTPSHVEAPLPLPPQSTNQLTLSHADRHDVVNNANQFVHVEEPDRWESGHLRGAPEHSIQQHTHRQGRTFIQQVTIKRNCKGALDSGLWLKLHVIHYHQSVLIKNVKL